MNVTTLLVLTTLFISVSNSLPKTSYIKMIEIYLLFSLSMPFSEVLLITLLDLMRYSQILMFYVPHLIVPDYKYLC